MSVQDVLGRAGSCALHFWIFSVVSSARSQAREKILSLVKSREAVGDEKFKESIRQWPVASMHPHKHGGMEAIVDRVRAMIDHFAYVAYCFHLREN